MEYKLTAKERHILARTSYCQGGNKPRRLRNIDHRVSEQVFNEVKCKIWPQANKTGAVRQYQLNVIDSRTITLCLRKYLRADYRKTKSGIKLHQRITIYDGNSKSESAILPSAPKADKTGMDELVVTSSDARP